MSKIDSRLLVSLATLVVTINLAVAQDNQPPFTSAAGQYMIDIDLREYGWSFQQTLQASFASGMGNDVFSGGNFGKLMIFWARGTGSNEGGFKLGRYLWMSVIEEPPDKVDFQVAHSDVDEPIAIVVDGNSGLHGHFSSLIAENLVTYFVYSHVVAVMVDDKLYLICLVYKTGEADFNRRGGIDWYESDNDRTEEFFRNVLRGFRFSTTN